MASSVVWLTRVPSNPFICHRQISAYSKYIRKGTRAIKRKILNALRTSEPFPSTYSWYVSYLSILMPFLKWMRKITTVANSNLCRRYAILAGTFVFRFEYGTWMKNMIHIKERKAIKRPMAMTSHCLSN